MTTLTITVPDESAGAVRDGVATVLKTLNLLINIQVQDDAPAAAGDDDVLAEARETLTRIGIDPATVTRIVFDTEEYDNGYFFTDHPTVVFRTPNDPATNTQAVRDWDNDWSEVAESLYEAHGGPLGAHAEAEIDLVTTTVIY